MDGPCGQRGVIHGLAGSCVFRGDIWHLRTAVKRIDTDSWAAWSAEMCVLKLIFYSLDMRAHTARTRTHMHAHARTHRDGTCARAYTHTCTAPALKGGPRPCACAHTRTRGYAPMWGTPAHTHEGVRPLTYARGGTPRTRGYAPPEGVRPDVTECALHFSLAFCHGC